MAIPPACFAAGHAGGQCRGDLVAHERLALVGLAFEVDHLRGRRADDQQLAVVGPGEKHVERPVRGADGHREVGALGGGGGVQRDLHRQRSVGAAAAVVVAPEQHEQGVAAELDDLAAVSVGGVDQRRETHVDQLGDLLGAGLALAGQLLRQRREARDVGRQHRPLDLGPGRTGVGRQLGGEARHEGGEIDHVGCDRSVGPLRGPDRGRRS